MENGTDALPHTSSFEDEDDGDEHYDYVEMFARALDRLRQGEATSSLVEEFEAVYRCFEEREKDFHAAVEVGQMLVEKNKQLMEAAEHSSYQDESSHQVEILKTRNHELHETMKEMEVKRDLFKQKYRSLEEARDKLLEYVKELEEEQRNNRLEIKANANAKRENRRLVKKLEQYKEEIQELMEKHEKMQKQNSQLRNDLMLLKEKRFSPEDRKILEGQIVELEKENKELKTIKEAFTKLKDAFAKLEAENVQLRGLADQNASLKTVIDNLTKLDHQRQVQLEQHRTLLEQARNTIAFLKQTLEEKGIVYDINALNSLSKGMAGSKWSLMEELERRLLEILQDKSKSREEMKEAIFAEIGGSVARLIEMEDEREKEKNERAMQQEEDSGDEEGMNGEDKAKMDEMLKTLNDRLDAGGNGAAAAASSKKAKKRANKRKKSPRGGKQKQNEDDSKLRTENEEEKHLAEKLRQKIAESLGQSKVENFDTPLEWARFVQASIDEWKRDVEEVKRKHPPPAAAATATATQNDTPVDNKQSAQPPVAAAADSGVSSPRGESAQTRAASEGGKKRRKQRKKGKGGQQQQKDAEKRDSRDPSPSSSGDMDVVVEVDIEPESYVVDDEPPTASSLSTTTTRIVVSPRSSVPSATSAGEPTSPRQKFSGAESVDSKSRVAQMRRRKLQRNLSLGEEMILSLSREDEERQRHEEVEKLTRLKERVCRLKDERAEWQRDREAHEALQAEHERLQVTARKAREEWNAKHKALVDKIKAKEERLGAMRRALEVKKRRIEEFKKVVEAKDAQLNELNVKVAAHGDAQALATKEGEWARLEEELRRQTEALAGEIESRKANEARLAGEIESLSAQLAARGKEGEWEAREECLRREIEQLGAQIKEVECEKRAQLDAKDQVIADLNQRVENTETALRELKEALATKSGELEKATESEARLREELETKEARLKEALSTQSHDRQRSEEDAEEKINLENQIKRLEDMLHSLIEEVDKKRMREEELLGEIVKREETIKELQQKIEHLEQLLNRQKAKRRVKQTHSMRLQRELVEAQQALEEQQRMADKLKQEMEQQEEDKRKELERVQKEMEMKSKEELEKEKERMQKEKENQRKELEKKHQKAGRAKDSELLAAFTAAAKEQVEMALTLAREAENVVERIEDVDKKANAANSIRQLKECSQEVINCVEATSNDPSNLQMQQALMQKQRELGQAIQRVVIHTTVEGATAKTELERAVEAMANATGAGVGDKSAAADDANADNVTVMAAAQEAIQEIEYAFTLAPATGQLSMSGGQPSDSVTLAGRILEKVKRFARLLKQVAAKTEDPKFKKEMLEYSNILPDRAIQLKIIAAVKSSSARDESSQLSSAAQGLKVSIQESLEILSVASLKKGLAATINQVSALKSLMSAWKNSNTLVFEV